MLYTNQSSLLTAKKVSLDMTGCKNAFLTLAILAFHSVTLRGLNCMHNVKLFRLGSFKQLFEKFFLKMHYRIITVAAPI